MFCSKLMFLRVLQTINTFGDLLEGLTRSACSQTVVRMDYSDTAGCTARCKGKDTGGIWRNPRAVFPCVLGERSHRVHAP